MTTTPGEVSEIVAGLTQAQRKMLGHLPLPALTCDWRVMPSLRKKGLAEIQNGSFKKLVPTHLGLAVRAHLERQDHV